MRHDVVAVQVHEAFEEIPNLYQRVDGLRNANRCWRSFGFNVPCGFLGSLFPCISLSGVLDTELTRQVFGVTSTGEVRTTSS